MECPGYGRILVEEQPMEGGGTAVMPIVKVLTPDLVEAVDRLTVAVRELAQGRSV